MLRDPDPGSYAAAAVLVAAFWHGEGTIFEEVLAEDPAEVCRALVVMVGTCTEAMAGHNDVTPQAELRSLCTAAMKMAQHSCH